METESRLRLVVLVESLVTNFVEEFGKRTSVLTLSFAAAAFVIFLTFASTTFSCVRGLGRRMLEIEKCFQILCLPVETWIWPFATEPPVSSIAQSLSLLV